MKFFNLMKKLKHVQCTLYAGAEFLREFSTEKGRIQMYIMKIKNKCIHIHTIFCRFILFIYF